MPARYVAGQRDMRFHTCIGLCRGQARAAQDRIVERVRRRERRVRRVAQRRAQVGVVFRAGIVGARHGVPSWNGARWAPMHARSLLIA